MSFVKIRSVPCCVLKQPFTLVDNQEIISFTFCGCFKTCRFVYRTSLLINKSMNTITLAIDTHKDLVILTTRRVQFIGITIRRSLLQCITQHQTILNNVKMNGVASVLLGTEVSEGSSGSHLELGLLT